MTTLSIYHLPTFVAFLWLKGAYSPVRVLIHPHPLSPSLSPLPGREGDESRGQQAPMGVTGMLGAWEQTLQSLGKPGCGNPTLSSLTMMGQ